MRINSIVKPRAARITARILTQALPYIQRFHGQHMVIKFGGNAMGDAAMQQAFAQDIVLLRLIGMMPIVVHGGGPQINKLLEALNIETEFVQGMRVTSRETMDVVEMVLGGQVNKAIVSLIAAQGGRAVGLTGKDGGLFRARRIQMQAKEGQIDIGHVGTVESVDTSVLTSLTAGGFIPIIAPIGADGAGTSLNINADLVAGSIAESLNASKLMLLTNTQGVLNDAGQTLTDLTPATVKQLKQQGTISGGMLPKLACAVHAIEGGVKQVHIVDGRIAHSVLLELFTDRGIGTLVEADED